MGNLLLMGAADTLEHFCGKTAEILQLVGWVVTVIKIGIPLIIIVLGLIDLGKAAISSKPEEIKKTVTSLVWRLVGGIAIFFVPTIVMLIMGFVTQWGDTKAQTDFNVCRACIETPWSSDCAVYKE